MADLTPLFQAAGSQSNVDPLLLKAVQQVENAPGDPTAVGPKPAIGDPNDRAIGLMQIRASNAKAAGIDPTDPTQAIPWAANTLAENMQRYNGNVEQAVAAYHGGTDPKNWGPLTRQYVDKVANAFNQLKKGAPMVESQQRLSSDPLLSMAQNIAQSGPAGNPAAPGTAPASSGDPLLDMAQGIATAKAPAPAATPAAPAMTPAGNVATGAVMKADGSPVAPNVAPPAQPMLPVRTAPQANAQDLAMGGASPDTWNQIKQIGAGGAHGISSFFNNAANLVEKGTAAGLNAIPGVRDTALARAATNAANNDVAVQSAADKQFSQNASPGAQAAAFVAPMILPMGGMTAATDAAKAGIQVLPGMGGRIGSFVGSTVGNAGLGAGMAAGAPIDANQDYWSQVKGNAGIGAALGGGLGAAGSIGSGVVNAIRGVAAPFRQPEAFVANGLAGKLGDDADAVANSIRNAQTYIPGSNPTTAQVTNNPVLVNTERALRNDAMSGFGVKYDTRQVANNAARDTAGTAASGDAQALAQALDQFSTDQSGLAAQGSRGLQPAGAPTTGIPTPDLSTPEFTKLLKQAKVMAENDGSNAFADLGRVQQARQSNPLQAARAQEGSQSLSPLGAPTTSVPAPNLTTPEFAPIIRQAKALAENDGSTAFADQAQNVNEGLLRRLRAITGETTDLDAAHAARADQAADNFLSTNVGIPAANTDYNALKQTPAFQSAFAQAQKMARNEGVQSIETKVQNRGNANQGGAIGAPQTYVSGKGLQYVKSALDDQIGAATRAGENAQARNLMGVKSKLLKIMDDAIPGYAGARDAYSQASRPIDAMTTLQAKTLLDANGNVSPTKLSSLVNSIETTQKKPGFRAADSVTVDQLNALRDLRDSAAQAKTNLTGLNGEGQDYIRRAVEANGTPEAKAVFQQYLKASSPAYKQYFSVQDGTAALGKDAFYGLSGESQEYMRRAVDAHGSPEAKAAYQQYLQTASPEYRQMYANQAGRGAELSSAKALADALEAIRDNTANESQAPKFGLRNVAQLERQPLAGKQAAYVDALKKDVLREQLSNARTNTDSGTAYNFSARGLPGLIHGNHLKGGLATQGGGAVGNAIGGAVGHLFGPAGGFAGSVLGHALGEALASRMASPRAKLNEALSDFLLNPEKLAPYLEKKTPEPAKRAALIKALKSFPAKAATYGVTQGNALPAPNR